jgi:hypothetical protein
MADSLAAVHTTHPLFSCTAAGAFSVFRLAAHYDVEGLADSAVLLLLVHCIHIT